MKKVVVVGPAILIIALFIFFFCKSPPFFISSKLTSAFQTARLEPFFTATQKKPLASIPSDSIILSKHSTDTPIFLANDSDSTPLGSEANPFLASTPQELMAALNQPISANQTRFIKLTADITYSSDRPRIDYLLLIKDDTVIDGANHFLIFDSDGYGSYAAGFRIGKPGIKVRLKNMNFGRDSQSKNSYYGIIGPQQLTGLLYFDVTFENITYVASRGAQPFFTDSRLTHFTFAGHNKITQTSGVGSQEWLEGNDVTFAKDSQTEINQDSSETTSFIYASAGGGAAQKANLVTISLEENAQVDLKTNKIYLVNGSVGTTINVGKNAVFKINAKNSFNLLNVAQTTTFNFNEGSYGEFDIVNGLNSPGAISINALKPKALLFKQTAGNFFNKNVQLNLTGSSATKDSYTYQTGNNQQLSSEQKVPLGKSELTNAILPKINAPNRALLARDVQNSPIATTTQIEPGISRLEAQLTYLPEKADLQLAEVKLSKSRLFEDSTDPNDPKNQQIIQNKSEADLVASQQSTESKFSFDDVKAGDYWLYAKVTVYPSPDLTTPRFTKSSFWLEQAVTIPKSAMIVTVPADLKFQANQSGGFASTNYQQPVQNLSNFPVAFTISTVVADNQNTIFLKPSYQTKKQELILNLATDKGDLIGPLKVGPNQLGDILLPDTHAKNIYLTGEYSGPNRGPQHVDFQFNYALRDSSQ